MARIDSLLSIAIDQGANELRVGSDREPRMFAFGAPKRLNIPSMSDDVVRELMGEILSAEREDILRRNGSVEARYQLAKTGNFTVALSSRRRGSSRIARSGQSNPRGENRAARNGAPTRAARGNDHT